MTSPKEKAASKAIHSCRCSSAWVEDQDLESQWRETSGVHHLTLAARVQDPRTNVWRGDPASKQGMKVLGVPLGRDEYAARFLEKKSDHHDTLFRRIPLVPDVQAS